MITLRRLIYPLLVIILTLPTTFPLLKPGFYLTHDGVIHTARFAKFYQALLDGQIIPRWADGVAFNLGSPVLMFYGQLPYFLASIPRFLGISFTASIEIILGLSLVLSGLAFFYSFQDYFGKTAALVGAVFYVFAPYRFLDVYVRGALPECLAFIFPPLIFLSLSKLLEKYQYRWLVLGSFSIAGLILSHNVMSLLFIGVITLYVTTKAAIFKKLTQLRPILATLLIGLSLSAFFWVPAILEKDQINIDQLNNDKIYYQNFASLDQIIYSKWGWGALNSNSPLSVQIGLVQLAVIILSSLFFILLYRNKSKEISLFFYLSLASILLSIFLITPDSAFLWENLPGLSFFLYPWRFLALIIFSSAILTSLLIYLTKQNKFLAAFFITLVILANRNHLQVLNIRAETDDNYYQNYTDSIDMKGEFLPKSADTKEILACRLTDCFFEKFTAESELIFTKLEQKSNKFKINYQSQKEAPATLNTYSFPGWNIYLDQQKISDIQINRRGTLDLKLPPGTHTLEARFEDPLIRKYSAYLSILTLLLLIGSRSFNRINLQARNSIV